MFSGSGVALITPFKNNKIDQAAFEKLVENQITQGTDFLVPCGTTGESATLTHEEHDQLIALTVKIARGRVKVLAGAGSNSTDEAIRLTKHAQDCGADGVLHINPYYNKPSQAGLLRHFEAITQAVKIPLVLYNIPGRTGINMLPETTAQLSQIDNIIGIKEASGSLTQVSDMIARCRKDFLILSGEDSLTFPMLALGAQGAISVTANVVPEKCKAMLDFVSQNNWESARKIHYELADLNEVLFIETNPVPVKTALHLMNQISNQVRSPLAPLMEVNLAKLKGVLEKHKLI